MWFSCPHHPKSTRITRGHAETMRLAKGTASEPVLSVVERMPTSTASKTPSALPKAGVKAQPQRLNRFFTPPQTPELHKLSLRHCIRYSIPPITYNDFHNQKLDSPKYNYIQSKKGSPATAGLSHLTHTKKPRSAPGMALAYRSPDLNLFTTRLCARKYPGRGIHEQNLNAFTKTSRSLQRHKQLPLQNGV